MDQGGEAFKCVRIFTCAIRDDVSKIKGKHLVFKASIAEIKTRVLIGNGSKAKMINESFVHLHGISIFKLTKKIKLKLGNGEPMQWLEKTCLVDVYIKDHHEQLLCYVANLDVYLVMLGDSWLQSHNSVID